MVYRFDSPDSPRVRVFGPGGGEVHTCTAVDPDEGWADILLVANGGKDGALMGLAHPQGQPITVRVQGRFTVRPVA